MKRSLAAVITLVLALLISSCSGMAPLGKAGLQGEGVLAAIRDLTGAYERRDLDTFMDKISTAYPDREGFGKSVEKIFSTYQSIHLKLHYTKILVMVQEKGNSKATFTWEGEWQTTGGKIVKDGARVTLVFDPGTYKLLGIDGKNMFIPSDAPSPARQ
jgi:hypothetical protein